MYAAERLTRERANAATAYELRDNRFHPEAKLPPAEGAELADYLRSGYDRGHMAPSGDMSTRDDDFDSFSLANMVPQAAGLNRSGWAALERYVRSLAVTFDTVFVVTGPSYQGERLQMLNGRVLVPTHVWKAVYVPGRGAGAWIATNEQRAKWKVVSIAALAAQTGVDPFPTLDPAAKRRIPKFPLFGTAEHNEAVQ